VQCELERPKDLVVWESLDLRNLLGQSNAAQTLDFHPGASQHREISGPRMETSVIPIILSFLVVGGDIFSLEAITDLIWQKWKYQETGSLNTGRYLSNLEILSSDRLVFSFSFSRNSYGVERRPAVPEGAIRKVDQYAFGSCVALMPVKRDDNNALEISTTPC
jgi:hypothetical protein